MAPAARPLSATWTERRESPLCDTCCAASDPRFLLKLFSTTNLHPGSWVLGFLPKGRQGGFQKAAGQHHQDNGCGWSAYKHQTHQHSTCCTHCKGDKGPHSKDCATKNTKLSPAAAVELCCTGVLADADAASPCPADSGSPSRSRSKSPSPRPAPPSPADSGSPSRSQSKSPRPAPPSPADSGSPSRSRSKSPRRPSRKLNHPTFLLLGFEYGHVQLLLLVQRW
jgi:hypothetical protein